MSSRPMRKGELLQHPGPDGWTVYDPDSDSLHVLNETARAIWELCDGETSPEEMIEAIAELTNLSVEDASDDVSSILRTLDDLGLVELADES